MIGILNSGCLVRASANASAVLKASNPPMSNNPWSLLAVILSAICWNLPVGSVLFVPSSAPPFGVQPFTDSQFMGSIIPSAKPSTPLWMACGWWPSWVQYYKNFFAITLGPLSISIFWLPQQMHSYFIETIETDKRVAPPILFVYWCGLLNMQCHMCCRAIKTPIIGAVVIA